MIRVVVDETDIGGGRRAFPTTHWSMILNAQSDGAARKKAMQELVTSYWKPLYYYSRRKGRDPEAAKDAIQGFITHLLEREFLDRLSPDKGRLRSYLIVALNRFLADQYDRDSALKRGGGVEHVPMDLDEAEVYLDRAPVSPEEAYHYGWALSLLDKGLTQLRKEFDSGKRTGPFALVQQFFGGGDPPSYKEAAQEFDMSVPQLKSFIHRTKLRFQEILMKEVAQTVPDVGGIDEELTDLMAKLNG